MRQSGLLPGLLVLALAVSAAPAQAQSSPTPPKDLKKVGDHWTAWDPPPAGPDAYIIVRGDNLWDLAGKWLGDNYLWPVIWDENRYVLDSHWIYPGDPLVVPGKPTVVPAEGPPPAEQTPPTAQPATVETQSQSGGFGKSASGANLDTPSASDPPAPPAPLLPLADPRDIYCTGSIVPEYEAPGLSILSAADPKEAAAEGDVVYLDHGKDMGVQPGDEYMVLRPVGVVNHPQTGRPLGQYVRRLGRVRVMLVHPTASTAVIEMSCEDMRIGDQLAPWADIPVPMARSIPPFSRWDITPTGGPIGQIVSTSDPMEMVAAGNVVHTDLGAASGVQPGNVVYFYRERSGLPRMNLAQGLVLTVGATTSTVKLTRSAQEAMVGDWVEVAN